MKILGIDPGHITGACFWDSEKPVSTAEVAEIHADDYLSFMKEIATETHLWKPEIIVIENYILRPQQYQGFKEKWVELPEAKQIGVAHLTAALLNIKCVEQEPSIKEAGYGQAGMKYVAGKPGMHMQDATAHAVFLARKGFDPSKQKNPFAKPTAKKKTTFNPTRHS